MSAAIRHWFAARLVPLSVAALVYAGSCAFAVVARPFLTGDEPHYLVYATSLGHGWGVDLRRAYREANHRSFYPGPLEPHANLTKDGKLVTWHGAGLPILLTPFSSRDQTPAGYRAVLIGIAALLGYHLYQLLVRAAPVSPRIAALSVLVLMLSPPVIVYASQVYPEIAAALLVVLAFRALVGQSSLVRRLAGAAAAAALLPLFNVRYGTLTMAFGLVIAGAAWVATPRRGARRVIMAITALRGAAAAGLLIGGALLGFHYYVYGAPLPPSDPVPGYYLLSNLYPFGAGAIIDCANGLLPMAPVLIIAVIAIPTTARRLGTLATIGAVLVAVVYSGYNGYFGSIGGAPPGRYIVSVVPLLALPLAVALSEGGRILYAATAAAIVAGAITTIDSARHFDLLYSARREQFAVMRVLEPLWPITLNAQFADLNQTADSIAHEVGTLETVDGARFVVAREGRDPSGTVAFGPSVPLRNGHYRVTVELLMEAPADRSEVRRDRGPDVVLEIRSEGERLARVVHDLPTQGMVRTQRSVEFMNTFPGRIEVRVEYGGRGTLGVGQTSSQLLAPLPMRDADDERWKGALWAVGLLAAAGVWRWRSGAGERSNVS